MKSDELVSLSKSRDILHIVSSHSTGGTLRLSDTPSDNVVVWFDSLTLGPALGATLEETTQIRRRFFLGSSKSRPFRDDALLPPSYVQRNRVLRKCGEWCEVALWFGPSVMEQFSLLQILAAIAKQNLKKARFTLVTCPKLALGVYRPEEMSAFFKSRATLPRKHIELAGKAWELYCQPDPMPLFHFARKHADSARTLSNALLRQLENYPSTNNGLTFSEEALLREVDARGTIVRAVGHVLGNDDEFRTGDVELFDALLGFLNCEIPLIEPAERDHSLRSFADFRKLAVKLTPAGRNVLSGQSDNITLNGIDRWIGGVHLRGKSVRWRWDSGKRILKRA